MKAAAFDYVAPTALEEAIRLLAGAPDEAKPLAGGQSLGPMLNLRLAMPALLVDLGRIEALRRVEDRGDHHAIGALVTHATLEDRIHRLADGGMLARVARDIAYRAVRNRGTIGGSLAHADPAADWLTALTVLDARLGLAGPDGRRDIALADFVRGAFTTALRPGEVIERVLLPKLGAGARWAYYKICRKPGEFAEAIGAVVLDPGRRVARIVAGALGGAPARLDDLAARVASDGPASADPETLDRALDAAVPGLDPVGRQLHAVALRRALDRIAPGGMS
ncbi:MAG TPA: FAD binding domain-containing protein [Stellaceae bacterium]|nr:FAD binding domain-containing protein [Stellaceae bacterium]